MKTCYSLLFLVFLVACSSRKTGTGSPSINSSIKSGSERLETWLPLVKGKKLGIFANQTSMVGNTHLVDTLQKLGVRISVIFGPEHGFRGTADAGEKVGNYVDEKTGLPVVSLYGAKHRPSAEDLKNVDILVFDIQDVGVRFYTFISSLQEYMECAFENSIPLLILDRPNPNGFYVDGPVLETKYKSFVGMQPVPIVYGMTIGEYALMLAGERWLSVKANERYQAFPSSDGFQKDNVFHFQVIRCENYTHQSLYDLPVKPSPNLPEIQSIYWYPSTCFFEGTVLSEGRGTEKPFQIIGHPSLPNDSYPFTPVSRPGAMEPKLKNQLCFGWNLSGSPQQVLKKTGRKIQLSYLLNAYRIFPDKEHFFILPKSGNADEAFFNKLAGNGTLMKQIQSGANESTIRQSWEPALGAFKTIRKKYLLYED
jgi:uncharacterized protein YbbC (DUF1343 family)